jgi:hypothetical protein
MVKVDEAGWVKLIQLVGNPVPAGQFKIGMFYGIVYPLSKIEGTVYLKKSLTV